MHGQTDTDRPGKRGVGRGDGEMVRNLPTIGEGTGKEAEMEATEIDSNLIGR